VGSTNLLSKSNWTLLPSPLKARSLLRSHNRSVSSGPSTVSGEQMFARDIAGGRPIRIFVNDLLA